MKDISGGWTEYVWKIIKLNSVWGDFGFGNLYPYHISFLIIGVMDDTSGSFR